MSDPSSFYLAPLDSEKEKEMGLVRTREFFLKLGYQARMLGFRANEDP